MMDSDLVNEPYDQAAQKRTALMSLLGIAFVSSLATWVFAGEGLAYSISFILTAVAQLVAIIYWCRADAEQRNFEFTFGQRLFIILFALVGLPFYLIKSRGFANGLIATGYALLFWILMFFISFATLVGFSFVEDRLGILKPVS
jgi:hypothetical protein